MDEIRFVLHESFVVLTNSGKRKEKKREDNNTGMAACRAVPCRVMSACYGRVPLRAVSSKSQPRVMPCHVTHFLPLVRAVSWRVMTFKLRVMACRVMACHVPLRAVACRVISMRFEVAICRG